MIDWNDGRVRTPGDFEQAAREGAHWLTADFACGYVQALTDAGLVGAGAVADYMRPVFRLEFARFMERAGDVGPDGLDDGRWGEVEGK